MLGGATRDYVGCYKGEPDDLDVKTEDQTGKAVMEAGYRVYWIGLNGGHGAVHFDFYENAKKTIEKCKMVANAVGPGNLAIDGIRISS